MCVCMCVCVVMERKHCQLQVKEMCAVEGRHESVYCNVKVSK